MTQHYMAIFQLHTKSRVWQVFNHFSLHLNYIVFRHLYSLSQEALKFAFFNKDSYCCDIM